MAAAIIISGREVAASVLGEVKTVTDELSRSHGLVPGLAVVIVGNDPASHVYVGAKAKMAAECGFKSIQHTLPADASQRDVLDLVRVLNGDPTIHGILVQLPLPWQLEADAIIQSISPEKDVDGLNVANLGKLASGDVTSGLLPCTPAGAMRLIARVHGNDLSGLYAVVVGRSNLFGKPMAQLLLHANATVTIAHSRTRQLPEICRAADILVVAVGRAAMVKSDYVKPGATVIDVGINQLADEGGGKRRLVGDVDFVTVREVAGAITPVPGGVGPMTIAMLMLNTARAAEKACRT